MKKKAFRAALPYTLPIWVGFLLIGASYGLLMRSKGFSVWYPMAMSALIYAGSMEFVTVNLLLSAFRPLYIGSGIWQGIGWTEREDFNSYAFILNEENIIRFVK